ncbi:MAG: sodium:solute symporter [Phycisphaerae bacterium]|nr:sodium:solute symporter [Phycisphaerae bacterium]
MLAMQLRIEGLDLTIIIAYFVIVITIGCLAGHRQRKSSQGGKDYFLAGGTLTWPMIGLALFSTNISTIHLVSQAQEGYMNGLACGNFEWMAPFTLIALSLFFVPFYIRSKVTTLPDFLEKRYSRASRNWLAVLSIVSAIFIHIGFSLYTGAVVLRGMFGIDLYTSIIGVSVLTGLYTIVGGLLAVVLTESIQTIILLAGAICITLFGLHEVGGWSGMAAHVEPVKLTMLRSADDPANLPWYSVFLGYPVIGLWYWCADQTIVQRVLGAKSENHARVGPLFTGFIKILPVFIFVMPGTIALALVNQGKMSPLAIKATEPKPGAANDLPEVEQKVYDALLARGTGSESRARVDEIAKETGLQNTTVVQTTNQLVHKKLARVRSDDVYAHMIMELLPVGLKGVVAAALLAALMSTVSGALNSIATLFCYDIYKQLRPNVPDRTLVRIGQGVTLVAMIISILWTPALQHYESIYQGVNTLISYIAPPITAVFVLGVFWRRASASGAFITLVAGSAMGILVFFLDWNKHAAWLTPYITWKVPFMMAAFYLFIACSAVMVVASLGRPDPPSAEKDALCWSSPLAALRGEAWPGLGNYRVLATILFVIMVALYIIFR